MANQLGIIHPRLFATALLPNFYPSLLTVQGFTESRSPTGAVIRSWGNVPEYTDLPCRIAPQSGRERRTMQQVLTQDVQTCIVPMALAVSTENRAIVNGDIFDIVSVDYDGQQTAPGLPGGVPRSTRLTLEVVI